MNKATRMIAIIKIEKTLIVVLTTYIALVTLMENKDHKVKKITFHLF